MKVIAFRIFGDFAHFRPYYTTSSPTTYSLMPPTSMIGLIGAVLGLDRDQDEYYERLTRAGIKVGIEMVKPLSKIMMGINLIMTKGNYWVPTSRNSNGSRSPTKYEFLRAPEYIIYVSMDDETLLNELAQRLHTHCHAYTISFGLANLLADIEFLEFQDADAVSTDQYVELDSAVPLSLLAGERPIEITSDVKYCKEQYVSSFAADRIPKSYVDVLFASNGRKLNVRVSSYYQMGTRKFVFLNE